MATVDIVILCITGFSVLVGMWRGFIKESLSLASWFAAIMVAVLFHQPLADSMAGLLTNPSLRVAGAFILLFVVTVFIGSMINNLVAKVITRSGVKGTDRALGGIFGLFRGGIIVALMVLLSIPFEFADAWFENSYLVPYALSGIAYLEQLLGVS